MSCLSVLTFRDDRISDCVGSGGLGLTGGLVDVGNLFDCLNGIHQGLADDSILDRYNEVRREKYLTIIDPVSSQNLRHLLQDPDVALKGDPLFQNMDMLKDPEAVAKLVTVSRASIVNANMTS